MRKSGTNARSDNIRRNQVRCESGSVNVEAVYSTGMDALDVDGSRWSDSRQVPWRAEIWRRKDLFPLGEEVI